MSLLLYDQNDAVKIVVVPVNSVGRCLCLYVAQSGFAPGWQGSSAQISHAIRDFCRCFLKKATVFDWTHQRLPLLGGKNLSPGPENSNQGAGQRTAAGGFANFFGLGGGDGGGLGAGRLREGLGRGAAPQVAQRPPGSDPLTARGQGAALGFLWVLRAFPHVSFTLQGWFR